MAKRLAFPTRASAKAPRRAKGRSPVSAGTFIQRSRAESSEQKAIWNQPTREFFGLSDQESEQCKALLARELGNRLTRLAK